MQKLSRIAAVAAVFMCVPAGVLLAQNPQNTATGTAATTAPTTAPATTSRATATSDQATRTQKKKAAKTTRQQEIDKSVESGTVPARYRKSVPKEYQQYIPFAK